ncbi:hypothetical protein EDC45_0172 [Mesocricetibacter intestinalis]|uniref:Uncharacterized protein n=1 Tax=Mesocricetibacter intestinalis TaxID=1521930 RepID=A0A4R6VF88_9PAST|nr:hypothetical protein EDC45_0172 [Mesocricetibacter intestinalis]
MPSVLLFERELWNLSNSVSLLFVVIISGLKNSAEKYRTFILLILKPD